MRKVEEVEGLGVNCEELILLHHSLENSNVELRWNCRQGLVTRQLGFSHFSGI